MLANGDRNTTELIGGDREGKRCTAYHTVKAQRFLGQGNVTLARILVHVPVFIGRSDRDMGRKRHACIQHFALPEEPLAKRCKAGALKAIIGQKTNRLAAGAGNSVIPRESAALSRTDRPRIVPPGPGGAKRILYASIPLGLLQRRCGSFGLETNMRSGST